ncbi:hypothetical protein BDU57DRAFT_438415 [Ampelomyces quisqualis]|uniref:DUF7730 domain-containing protein n=1 Tax=Ampelomyces quisqualis TaxID=50730 RepID=A0A6A5R138_AMPQU|nr:hypothetical protein BDU57DRAFT_438415 [Ampelomyces quisqualis]
MDELDVSDAESDFECAPVKKRKAAIPGRLSKGATKTLPNRKFFPFLLLPAEIRNMIYSYALTDRTGINLVGCFKHRRRTVERVSADMQATIPHGHHWSRSDLNYGVWGQYEKPSALVPSLLAVSKQIHQEACDILYDNDFIFADSFTLYNFLLNLGPTGAKQLKRVRMLDWCIGRGMKGYNHACFALLVQATNLKTFRFDKLSGWASKASGAASKFYRDANPWLEAVAAAKGKVDAGVDMLDLTWDMFEHAHWQDDSERMMTAEERQGKFMTTLRELLGKQQKRLLVLANKKKKSKKEPAKRDA